MIRGESRENINNYRNVFGKTVQGRTESKGAGAGGLCDPIIVL